MVRRSLWRCRFLRYKLNSSLEQYLELTPEQSSAIRQVMARERPYVVPQMAEFNATRQKLEMATRSSHPDQKQIRSLALIQARLLTKLVAARHGLARQDLAFAELGAAKKNRETQAGQRSERSKRRLGSGPFSC